MSGARSTRVLGWHFVGATLRDGRPVPPDGEWLVHEGRIEMCRSGLHASKRILDALQCAPGGTICRVSLEDVEQGGDKMVGRRRLILWRVDGHELLRRFARRCALDVIHLWRAPTLVVDYLRTGNDELRAAAGNAAWYAAWKTAWNAARNAVWYAAWSAREAARNAVWSAARYAAWYAAWNARNAARDAVRDKQDRRLVAMVMAERRKQHANYRTLRYS